jgi:hypothetical protein
MKIEISDELVEQIVVKELQWAHEQTYNATESDLDAELDFRESLEDVLRYFMPLSQQNNYFKMIEDKYER